MVAQHRVGPRPYNSGDQVPTFSLFQARRQRGEADEYLGDPGTKIVPGTSRSPTTKFYACCRVCKSHKWIRGVRQLRTPYAPSGPSRLMRLSASTGSFPRDRASHRWRLTH